MASKVNHQIEKIFQSVDLFLNVTLKIMYEGDFRF